MLRTSIFFLQRHTGICCEWQIEKNFGFIIDKANKKRQFAHVTAIAASILPHKALSVGEQYEFDIEPDEQGTHRCARITAVGGGPVEGSDIAPPNPPRPQSRLGGSYAGDEPQP